MKEYGKIVFTIDEVLKEKGISKNQLSQEANLQRTQLNSYCNNKVRRIDLDVLARICSALKVRVEDILRYESLKK